MTMMRRKLFFFTICLILGIVLAYYARQSRIFLAVAAGMFLLILVWCGGRKEQRKTLAVLAAGILIGGGMLVTCQIRNLSDSPAEAEGGSRVFTAEIGEIERMAEQKYQILCRTEDGLILCSYSHALEDYPRLIGRKIQFSAQVQRPKKASNPGTFDYRLYLASENIFLIGEMDGFQVLAERVSLYPRLKQRIIGAREQFIASLALSQQAEGLVRGILFGDTNGLDEEIHRDFRQNGTAHVLAVSGLHIGVLYGIYKRLAGRRKSPGLLVLFALFLLVYGTVTLWSVSVRRAVGLIVLSLLGDLTERRYDLLTGLAFLALVAVIRNPYVIFGASFQMSFLAVLSMTFFGPLMTKKTGESAGVMLSVQLGLMPYLAYTFNHVSLTGLLVNPPVIFLVSLLVPAGIFGYVLYLLFGLSVPAFSPVLEGLSNLLIAVNHDLSLDGILSFDVVSPPLWLIAAVYGAAFFLTSETCYLRFHRKGMKGMVLPVCVLLMIGMLAGIAERSPFDKASLVFVDVGQGDCLHLRTKEGKNLLIDGGGSIRYNVGEKILKPYLLKNGAGRVELAAATHLHTDHYLGLEQLAACYPVEQLLCKGQAGQRIAVEEDVWIDILWPKEPNPDAEDENLNSLIFKLYDRGTTTLITGDITAEGEAMLVQAYKGTNVLKADILKVAHHGSAYSTSDAFLDAVRPSLAVISVGKNNYGHPGQMIIEKLQKRSIMVVRTDVSGAVGIIHDRKGTFSVCTENP